MFKQNLINQMIIIIIALVGYTCMEEYEYNAYLLNSNSIHISNGNLYCTSTNDNHADAFQFNRLEEYKKHSFKN